VVRTELPKPALARFVRFYPLECVGGHSGLGKMRVSVFGNSVHLEDFHGKEVVPETRQIQVFVTQLYVICRV